MGVLDVPKAMYKAQQAKKQMSKIQVAGLDGAVSVLMNGLNEIVEVEIDVEQLTQEDMISKQELERIVKRIQDSMRKAVSDARKQIEKELINSTNLEDLKGMLGM